MRSSGGLGVDFHGDKMLCSGGSIRRLLVRLIRSPLPLFGSRLFRRSGIFLERSPLHFVPNGTEDRIHWSNFEIRGLIPHDQPAGHLVRFLPAFCPQMTPVGPFLPVVPVRKYCAVYSLWFDSFHGMEEVVGSIPTRSTNKPL